ncbi:MAG: hypothetical protein KBD56_06250 [Candidatus Eisenbacteria bacterium]|nr:hypothetical protein [Candidatus Eisenbacteria bacterium]
MTRLPARMLAVALLFALLVCAASAYTGDHPKMKVRIAWPSEQRLTALQDVPDLDPMRVVPGEEVILVSSPDQVAELRARGFEVEVLSEDMEAEYAAQREGLLNFGLLFTYSEAVAQLDALHAAYPNITTAKFSIGTTILGNPIWAMKVSDNPDLDEDEPEVLFDALHHAREPITVNVTIETIRYLCQNYGSDSEVTFLVNNRETFFVPVLNVDGYLYNESTYPQGGGMWRKNRRDNSGSCDGVDLNRNYPNHWSEVGTSFDPCDETYCGASAGSEPCVQALMNFILAHNFVTHDSYHSVSALILFPWSWTTAHTPDDATFRSIANTLRQYCGYTIGQPGEVLYDCSGTTTDWAYANEGVFSFCTEVDGSGFWPEDSEVAGLVAENIPKNLYLMKIAGPALTVADHTLSGGDGDQTPDPGETVNLVVTLNNEGLSAAANAALVISSDDPYLQLVDPTATIGAVPARGSASNSGSPLVFAVDPACPSGHTLTLDCRVQADGFHETFTLEWMIGAALFADDVESGVGGWTHGPVTSGWTDQWHQSTTRNHTPGGDTSWKFGDTGAGSYASNSDGGLVTPAIVSNGALELTFWHWMDAEVSSYYTGQAYDGGLIEVSYDGGAWSQVTPAGGYTHIARGSGPFAAGTAMFSGSISWRQESITINDYAGSLRFRFRFGSDSGVVREGWYVDDIVAIDRTVTNRPPTAPVLVGPLDGETVPTMHPVLTVQNSTDLDGDDLTYGFRIYTDAQLTQPFASVIDVPEGAGTTSWTVSAALPNGTYYWRAFADDGSEWGPCMEAVRFIVESSQGIAERDRALGLRVIGTAPSPAPGWTAVRFEANAEGWVHGRIFDLSGRLVRTLDARCSAGTQDLLWDGRNDAGDPVPGGMYLYRFGEGRAEQTGRIVMLR